jgi:hypothetical protein
MGKTRKKEMRRKFRDAVFERDGYRCVVCGFESSPERAEHEIDAHHITPREEMPNGGYVKENGVTLCDPSKTGGPLALGCHYRAEQVLLRISQGFEIAQHPEEYEYEYTPEALYEAVGSSREEAERASEYLK